MSGPPKALASPVRLRILERLGDHGVASPGELADALGEPLGKVNYHVRILREHDCLDVVRTEPRRGALSTSIAEGCPRGWMLSSGPCCRQSSAARRSPGASQRSSKPQLGLLGRAGSTGPRAM
jgi:hypothetical protein